MTGSFRLTICVRQARISGFSQGPSPSLPTRTAEANGCDDLLDGLLPRAPRDQFPFVQPDLEAALPQSLSDLADGRLVLAVMAEEDVEGLGQGRLLVWDAWKFTGAVDAPRMPAGLVAVDRGLLSI